MLKSLYPMHTLNNILSLSHLWHSNGFHTLIPTSISTFSIAGMTILPQAYLFTGRIIPNLPLKLFNHQPFQEAPQVILSQSSLPICSPVWASLQILLAILGLLTHFLYYSVSCLSAGVLSSAAPSQGIAFGRHSK